jgi:hypothetical protein
VRIAELIRVEDETGKFTEDEMLALLTFIQNDLLSAEQDWTWLPVIRIHKQRGDCLGTWDVKIESNESGISVDAVIYLNCNLCYFLSSEERMEELKHILAHEYGHHWTLIYLLVSGQMRHYFSDRLPDEYYNLRNLDKESYAPNYDLEWERCDKEIIAEDYKVLFAPHPFNASHQIIEEYDPTLTYPSQEIADYIRSLGNLV